MKYFIDYNGKFIAIRKILKGCLKFIKSREIINDEDNILRIFDENGGEYNPINGNPIIH